MTLREALNLVTAHLDWAMDETEDVVGQEELHEQISAAYMILTEVIDPIGLNGMGGRKTN